MKGTYSDQTWNLSYDNQNMLVIHISNQYSVVSYEFKSTAYIINAHYALYIYLLNCPLLYYVRGIL